MNVRQAIDVSRTRRPIEAHLELNGRSIPSLDNVSHFDVIAAENFFFPSKDWAHWARSETVDQNTVLLVHHGKDLRKPL
jgi:hypothetical protein